MRLLRVAAMAVLAVGCGKTIEPTTSTLNVKVIGSEGGTVVGQGGVDGAEVVIPFGALAQKTPIALGEDPQPPAAPAGMEEAGPSLLCSPEGLEFKRPATLLLPYRGLSDVQLYTAPAIEGAAWEAYDGGEPDAAQNVLRAGISHFSRWRAFRLARPDAGSADGG